MQVGKIPLLTSNFKLGRIGGSIRGSPGMIKTPRSLTFPEFAGHDPNLLRYEGFAHGSGALTKLEELKEFFREPDVTLPTYIDLGDGEFWGVPKRFSYQKVGGYKDHWTFTLETLWNDITGPVNKQNMVLELLMNEGEGSTVYDTSGNENDGTIYGGVWEESYLGKTVYCNGNDFIELLYSSSLDITGNVITIEAWLKIPTEGIERHAICGKWESSKYQYLLQITDRNPTFEIYTSSSKNTQGNTTIDDDKYHHVCGVYNGSEIIIYLDGADDNTTHTAQSGNMVTRDISLVIATYLDKVKYLKTNIKEIRIWERALSATEVYANSRRYNV